MFKMLKKSEKYNTHWCQTSGTKKKTEAEAGLKKLLASGMSADEILEKLK